MLYESSYYGIVQMDDVIEHHGIKGMKWGIRRYQNPDGSLTSAGKARYGYSGKVPNKRKRFSEKMYRKYGLVDTPENKDAAWDNASEMAWKGASNKELGKYLKENGMLNEAISEHMPKDRVYLNDIQLATDKAIAELKLYDSMRERASKSFKGDGKFYKQNVARSQSEFDKNVKLWTETDYDSLPKKDADAVIDYQGKISRAVYDWYNDTSRNPRVSAAIKKKNASRGTQNERSAEDALWKTVVEEAGLKPTEENIRKMKALLASD